MKRVRIFGLAIVAIVASWTLLSAIVNREPKYQGRKLSQWLDRAEAVTSKSADPEHPEHDPQWLECQTAVLNMGSGVVPLLLRDLTARPSSWKSKIAGTARVKPLRPLLKRNWIGRLNRTVAEDEINTTDRHLRAVIGFSLLGSSAETAQRNLIALTKDDDNETRLWGFFAFAATKPAKDIFVPVVVRLMQDPDREIRENSAQCLQELYPEAAEEAGVYEAFPDLRIESTKQ